MKRLIPFFLLAAMSVATPFTVCGQKQMSENNRREWTQRMRDLKHSFLIEALNLTREQQNQFFPLYDSMEDELNALTAQSRELESRMEASGSNITDIEYSTAAKTLFEQKSRENEVEMTYFAKFEKILTPKQLFQLKGAERNFTGQVVRRHGRMRNENSQTGERGPRR